MRYGPSLLLFMLLGACWHRSPEAAVLAFFKHGQAGPVCGGKHTEPLANVVRQLTADTAIVGVWFDCVQNHCAVGEECSSAATIVRYQTDYLVVRKQGAWKVERPVSAGQAIGI